MSGSMLSRRKVAGMLGFGALALISGSTGARAETTSETGVSVEVADAGALDVHFSDQPVRFLSDGEDPAPTAAESAVATGTFTLIVQDTRADESRRGYTVAISSSGFQTEDGGATLDAANLVILDVQGLPGDASAAQLIGATLDQPVTLLTAQEGDPALDATIAVTIQLTIPSGSMPGAYSGGFELTVAPLAAPGV